MVLRSLLLGICTAIAVTQAAAPEKTPEVTLKKVGEFRLQTTRQGAAAVAYKESIYVFGGSYDGGHLTDVERIDLRTQRSERVFNQMVPRRYHRALEFKGRVYLFGGVSDTIPRQPYEDVVEIYDIATNTVKRGRSLPEPRGHIAAARLGDKFVLTGGAKLKDGHVLHTNETDIYDPATDAWAKGVPMPTPREAHAVTVGSMVIVPAGFRGNMALANVEFFVPQENVWKSLPPLSRRISAHALAHLDKYLFFFGDYADLDLVLAYNLETRTTHPVRTTFTPARHSIAVVAGGKIYVIGGNRTGIGEVLDLVQVFALER